MTTKADIFEPLALKHYTKVAVYLEHQPDGNIVWSVERSGSVPSTVADVPPLALQATRPIAPEAIAQVISLVQQLVLPVDAEALGINVAQDA